MRYLAETHIVLWYLNGDEKLPNKARELIDDDKNEIFFSLAVPPKVNLDKFAKANKVVKRSGDFHCFSSTLVFLNFCFLSASLSSIFPSKTSSGVR